MTVWTGWMVLGLVALMGIAVLFYIISASYDRLVVISRVLMLWDSVVVLRYLQLMEAMETLGTGLTEEQRAVLGHPKDRQLMQMAEKIHKMQTSREVDIQELQRIWSDLRDL